MGIRNVRAWVGIAIWFAAFSALGGAGPGTSVPLSRRAVLLLDRPESWPAMRRAFPADARIYAHEGVVVLVELSRDLRESDLATFRALPGVVAAEADRPVFPAQSTAASTIPCDPVTGKPLLPGQNQLEAVLARISGAGCRFGDVCPEGRREKLWAQKRAETDLMLTHIKDRKLRSSSVVTPVVVVDTGLNDAESGWFGDADHRVRAEPGVFGLPNGKEGDPSQDVPGEVSLVGPPGEDRHGHGTSVASVIAGPGGMGVAPHASLSVYRVTRPDPSPSPSPSRSPTGADAPAPKLTLATSAGFLSYAIHRACRKSKEAHPDSVPVINFSWAARPDESGVQRDEVVQAKLMKYLADQGCLVIKAAGNSSYRTNDEYVGKGAGDFPYLRVAATQPFNGLASYSSNGALNAPGDRMVLVASSASPDGKAAMVCQANFPARFIGGTSFAAPLVAGVASEVAGVLASLQSERYRKLSASDRVVLLTRILKASARDDLVSGYRAVLIAERWAKAVPAEGISPLDRSGVPELQALLAADPPEFCKTFSPSCLGAFSGCRDFFSCFDTGRRVLSVCHPFSPELARSMSEAAVEAGAFDTALGIFGSLRRALDGRAPAGAPVTEREVQALLRRVTNKLVPVWDPSLHWNDAPRLSEANALSKLRIHLPVDALPALIEPFVQSYRGTPKAPVEVTPLIRARAKALVLAAALSSQFRAYLLRGPGRGSEEVLGAWMRSFEHLGAFTPKAERQAMVRAIFADILVAPITRDATVMASRLSLALRDASSGEDWEALLDGIDAQVLAALDGGTFYYHAAPRPFSELEDPDLNRSYVCALLARMKRDPLLSANGTPAACWAEALTKEAPDTLAGLGSFALEATKRPGWASYSDELLGKYLTDLARLARTASFDQLAGLLKHSQHFDPKGKEFGKVRQVVEAVLREKLTVEAPNEALRVLLAELPQWKAAVEAIIQARGYEAADAVLRKEFRGEPVPEGEARAARKWLQVNLPDPEIREIVAKGEVSGLRLDSLCGFLRKDKASELKPLEPLICGGTGTATPSSR